MYKYEAELCYIICIDNLIVSSTIFKNREIDKHGFSTDFF